VDGLKLPETADPNGSLPRRVGRLGEHRCREPGRGFSAAARRSEPRAREWDYHAIDV